MTAQPGALPNPAPGDRIGAYVLQDVVGEGAFGTVYRAQQLEPVRRLVALKLLKAADIEQLVERFAAESQVLARMDHPCIASVFDAGATDAGRPYVVTVCGGYSLQRLGEQHLLGRRSYDAACQQAWIAYGRLIEGILDGRVGRVLPMRSAS